MFNPNRYESLTKNKFDQGFLESVLTTIVKQALDRRVNNYF